jgi:hypothetical protein
MGSGLDDMEHIGMHFSNAGIGRGTQHISAAEIAADMSHFVTHIGVAEMQAETLRFS